nr:hypothetical protein [Sphingomonas sp. T1]
MKRKQFSEEQIIGILKEAEAGRDGGGPGGRGGGCAILRRHHEHALRGLRDRKTSVAQQALKRVGGGHRPGQRGRPAGADPRLIEHDLDTGLLRQRLQRLGQRLRRDVDADHRRLCSERRRCHRGDCDDAGPHQHRSERMPNHDLAPLLLR